MPPISNEAYFLSAGYSAWGRWQVRKSPVDDPTDYSLVEDLGPNLKAVYIEADGEFEPDYRRNHFIFLSDDDNVWLAFILPDDRLFVKKVGEPVTNATLIAEHVTEACLCRSWRSDEHDKDSGLFIGYITTSGAAAYRVYKPYQGVRTWGPEDVLEQTGAEHIQIIRTNDYRTCVYVYPSRKAYLTDRDYVSGTVRTEFVYEQTDLDFLVFATETVDEPIPDFAVTEVKVIEPALIRVTANYPFYSRDPNWEDVSCTTNPITRFYLEDGFLWLEMSIPITSTAVHLEFHIRAFNRLRFEKTANCRPLCPETTFYLEPGTVRFTESVLAAVSFNSAAINSIPVVELYGSLTDTVYAAVSFNSAAISSIPVVELYGSLTDTVYAEVSYVSAGIGNEMTGDVPV